MIDIRCVLPAHGFKTGHCDGLLFRVTEIGDLQVKCHRCKRIFIVPRSRIQQPQLVST